MQTTDRYRIEIFYSRTDKCYIARVPDVKFVMADGPTPEKALAEVKIALAAALEVLKEEGHPLPKPSPTPECWTSEKAS
jgi:predicted RNase H-like HicB family nuclease